jgi:hypothetical protein
MQISFQVYQTLCIGNVFAQFVCHSVLPARLFGKRLGAAREYKDLVPSLYILEMFA